MKNRFSIFRKKRIDIVVANGGVMALGCDNCTKKEFNGLKEIVCNSLGAGSPKGIFTVYGAMFKPYYSGGHVTYFERLGKEKNITENQIPIGKKIKQKRLKAGITLFVLSEKTQISINRLEVIESCIEPPMGSEFRKIQKLLGFNFDVTYKGGFVI